MDSQFAPALPSSNQALNISNSVSYSRNKLDALIIETSLSASSGDRVTTGLNSSEKGLVLTAREIVDRINELLKIKLPNGIESLKPQEVTPEATADRIVSGVTAFFDIYAKQHPDLSDEDLVTSFMDTIRGGVEQGYSDAYGILEGLGAFQFEGVRAGVEHQGTGRPANETSHR